MEQPFSFYYRDQERELAREELAKAAKDPNRFQVRTRHALVQAAVSACCTAHMTTGARASFLMFVGVVPRKGCTSRHETGQWQSLQVVSDCVFIH
jgi:hypothetical protein